MKSWINNIRDDERNNLPLSRHKNQRIFEFDSILVVVGLLDQPIKFLINKTFDIDRDMTFENSFLATYILLLILFALLLNLKLSFSE